MPCLKCGGKTEDEALICDTCATACFQDSRFFLNPILIGRGVFFRLRDNGSAAHLLGPNTRSNLMTVSSSELMEPIRDLNVHALPHDELQSFYARCDTLLAHLGVPLKIDSPQLLVTSDSADAIMAIVQKVNATEKMYQGEGMSDLYIRMGVVYWAASHGLLLRVSSKNWQKERRSYLTSRAKELLSKIQPGDDLYSIASRTLGLLCLDAEEWTAAEENLASAYVQFPNDAIIGEGLARAHLMLGNPMEAISRIDEVINQGEKPEYWVLKGKILKELDRNSEALECFSRAISLDSRYLPAHDIMIQTLRDLGRMDEAALAESQRSLARRPDLDRKISELMAEYSRPEGQAAVTAAAVGVAVRESGRQPPSPPAEKQPIDLARDSLREGDFDTAIQRSQHILEEDPGMRDANLLVIEALVAKGDLARGSARVRSYYEKNKEDPYAWYWRGVVAEKQGKWGASVQYFSKAVTLDPKLVDAWVSMGDVLFANGKTAGADESYSRALDIDRDNHRAWLGKAKAMRALGRWGAAIQSMDKYTTLVPGDAEIWKAKGDLLFEKEKYSRAIESYDRYLELAQDDSYVLGRKGISLNAIGMAAEAKACLEESVRLDPNNKEAAHWLKTVSGGGA